MFLRLIYNQFYYIMFYVIIVFVIFLILIAIINYDKFNLTHGRGESNIDDNIDVDQLYVNLVNEKPNHIKNTL